MIRALLWSVIASLLAAVAVSVAAIVYTGRTSEEARIENDRQWCALLVTLNEAYSSQPPQTELGRRVATAIADLTDHFGCKG